VLVGGKPVKLDGKLVAGDLPSIRSKLENTVEYLRSELGDETWKSGMNPEIPEVEILTNPYQYRRSNAAPAH
jgi:hypothetical protein